MMMKRKGKRPMTISYRLLLLSRRLAFALALLAGLPTAVHGQEGGTARTAGVFFNFGPELPSGGAAGGDLGTSGRSRTFEIDFDQLAEARLGVLRGDAPVVLTLNLFDDVVLSAIAERTAPTASGTGYVLSGRLDLEEDKYGRWKLLVYGGNVITGAVRKPDAIYGVRTMGGVHGVSETARSGESPRFEDRMVPASGDPTDDPPNVVEPPSGSGRGGVASVDVAVVYRPEVVELANNVVGDAGIDGLIDTHIDNVDEAFDLSGVALRIQWVWRGPFPCEAAASVCSNGDDSLDYLARNGFELRNKVGADLLSWLVDIKGFVGVARTPIPLPSHIIPLYYSHGNYSVVQYDTIDGPHSNAYPHAFAHELGHNMALRHDRWATLNVDNKPYLLNTPHPYSHGYASPDCEWMTIMSYEHRCNEEQKKKPEILLRFSDPNQKWEDGQPMGVAGGEPSSDVDGPADAVRSLNERRWDVEAYWAPANDKAVLQVLYNTAGEWRLGIDQLRIDKIDPRTRFTSMEFLDGVDGPLTSTLGTLGQLKHLALAGFFRGRIPVTLGRLHQLEYLRLSGSYRCYDRCSVGLTGPIPSALGELAYLRVLELFKNYLTGPIPPELGNLANLKVMNLWLNDLTGSIPREFGNLTELEELNLGRNLLKGEIPRELGRLENLVTMMLSDNELTGTIPATFGGVRNLVWLNLSRNQLTGQIPATLGDLTSLTSLKLERNQLTGQIPAALGDLPELRELYLQGNRLSGPIPPALGNLNLFRPTQWGRGLTIDGHTGLCLPADFPRGSVFFELARDWGVPDCGSNLPPVAVGTLAPVSIAVGDPAVSVDVAGAFEDPEGDRLTYGATSSVPEVATVLVSGSTLTVAAVAPGRALATVTATDEGGSNVTVSQTFTVTVPRPFTDHPIVPGQTPVKALHFRELRERIDAVRAASGRSPYLWTDPVLSAGETAIRLVHVLELRSAIDGAYRAAGRAVPVWTDGTPVAGETRVRAAHVMELRAAVSALQ